jgi:hypothetical protein
VKLAPLRCPACGRERNVRERERGTTVACDGCGATFDVPEHLAFPDYAELQRDRVLAINLELVLGLAFLLCCLPASASAWWLASGALEREIESGRPPDPYVVRVNSIARALTVLQLVLWGAAFVSWL